MRQLPKENSAPLRGVLRLVGVTSGLGGEKLMVLSATFPYCCKELFGLWFVSCFGSLQYLYLTIYNVPRCQDTKMSQLIPERSNLGANSSEYFMDPQVEI